MAVTFPFDCYLGLAVAGVEVTAPGYVRQPATLALTADGTAYSNLGACQWQHATQDWGLLDTVQIWGVDGKALGGAPAPAVLIVKYDIARVPAAGLSLAYVGTSRGFGTGGFGTLGFGAGPKVFTGSAMIERGFDQQHVCAPGTWAPGPFAKAA